MTGGSTEGNKGKSKEVVEQNSQPVNIEGVLRTVLRELARLQTDVTEIKEGRAERREERHYQPMMGRRLEEEFDEVDFNEGDVDRRRYERGRNQNRREDDNLSSIKSKIPEFQGKNDPEAYIEWEKKIENVFDIYNYSDRKKVKLAVTEFTDYALTWWDQMVTARRRNREHPIENWAEMKVIMRKRFVPAHYYREVQRRLLRLTQGNRSIEEYYKEMEVLLIRSGIEEDEEMTMARFLAGMNTEISNEVELHHYLAMEDLVHKAIQVERQFKAGTRKVRFSDPPSWKPTVVKKENKPFSSFSKSKSRPSTSTPTTPRGNSNEPSSNHNRDIRCYKCQGRGHITSNCPNKRTMLLREDGEYETEEETMRLLKRRSQSQLENEKMRNFWGSLGER